MRMRFARLMTLALAALGLTMTLPAAAQEPSGAEATPEAADAAIDVPEGWSLVWHDEFDGDAIDESSWTYDLGAGGWGNGEAQHYTNRPENARIEDGMLVIEARQERYMGSYYTSARLKTEGLREFQYGRIEARVRVPAGRGLWPAFWMLGSNIREVGWPDCGEIDIMEYIGREPDLILGTIHGPGYSGALGLSKWNRQEYDIADDFHTYAIEWDENQITWFYDGDEYSTYTRADVGERDWPFDQPFFIILNLALGGQFPGPIGLDVVFPTQYVVDYVRVFQSAST
ncbi:MAG: glycoside hydrolase family 16 protein [Anaerolineae bacterium]|nr:glycoside hydrolase family 16 protein [Anaerolineae bacterium]